jgi:hypothetical protein
VSEIFILFTKFEQTAINLLQQIVLLYLHASNSESLSAYMYRKWFIGELANLTTKIMIITLLEFFNFVSEVSRLQYV